MDRIINMIIRQVMNQLIRRGVNAGFDRIGGQRRGQQKMPPDAIDGHGNPVGEPQEMTPEERRQRRAARQEARRARQAMKAARKVTKF